MYRLARAVIRGSPLHNLLTAVFYSYLESICIGSPGVDPSIGNATLEVGLNNPILEAGFEIICAPTSEPTSLDSVKKTLQVCQVELHPFFVYGHNGKVALDVQVGVPGVSVGYESTPLYMGTTARLRWTYRWVSVGYEPTPLCGLRLLCKYLIVLAHCKYSFLFMHTCVAYSHCDMD